MRSPVKGWCPTVFEPMSASDGLLITVKPRVCGWSPQDLRLIAAQALEHGSGALLLTQRANLQVRGVRVDGLYSFARALADAGLLSATADAERRRNVVLDTALPAELDVLAAELEQMLEVNSSLASLPAKFSFAWVAEGGDERLTAADCAIHASGEQFYVVPAASPIGASIKEPVAVAMALANAFVRLSANQVPKPRRMQELIAAVGVDTVLRECGLQPAPFEPRWSSTRVVSAGPLAYGRFAIAIPFGRLHADQLITLAALTECHSSRKLRLTADRAFLLSGVEREARLAASAEALGFIVNPTDPRLRIAVCSGGAGCAHSTIDMPTLAERLAPLWQGDGVLHLSGCSKGCAHSRSAAVTCVARSSEKSCEILYNARADGTASLRLSLDELPRWLSRFSGSAPS